MEKNKICDMNDMINCNDNNKNISTYIKSIEYRIKFNHDFNDPETINPYLNILEKATYNDTVIFDITSCGGQAETAFTLRTAILNCKAKTVARVNYAASAATILALSCEELVFAKNCSFMIHAPQCYLQGKLNNIKDKMDFNYKRYCNIFTDVYSIILSKNEINELINGKDFWFNDQECLDRLQKIAKVKQKQKEKNKNE